MNLTDRNTRHILILIVLSYFFFIFGNGLISLTNPDEVFYAQTAKEMALHKSWITPVLFDQPQFEKPIFIYWLLRIAFWIFGINSFSARFFPAFFASLGVMAVYLLGKLLFKEEKKAFLSALVLLSSGLYIGLARTVFTDMVFSVLILFSLLSFFWGFQEEKNKGRGILLFFIFSALAVLTKGPLGLIIPLLVIVIFLILVRKIKFILCKYAFWGIILFFAITLPWYIIMVIKYNKSFTSEFFFNDHYRRITEAEHFGNDTWYFYPLTMLGGMFPWSIFVVFSVFGLLRHFRRLELNKIFLASWIVVTLLIFQFAHSKLTSYIFPMFSALALLCGDFLYDFSGKNGKSKQFFRLSFVVWGSFIFILGAMIFGIFKFSSYISSFLPVIFLIALSSVWLIAFLFFLLKKKSAAVIPFIMVFMPILLTIIPFIVKDIEPYISSQYACTYFLKNYPTAAGSYLLSSNSFARGTRFYTDKKIAILASSAKNFFSPHPIPFLNTDDMVREFLRQHAPIYGLFKKSSLEDLDRILGNGFEYQVLKNIGNQYIVRIWST